MVRLPLRSFALTESMTEMPLIARGRLSVQPVNEAAYTTIELLAKTGGWDEKAAKPKKAAKGKTTASKKAQEGTADGDNETAPDGEAAPKAANKRTSKKRKAPAQDDGGDAVELRRSTRKRS